MSVLTVLLASEGPAQGVRDVLTDLSAAGLVSPFLWIDEGGIEPGTTRVHVTEVADGVESSRLLQDVLASRHSRRVRLCVLVPLVDGAEPVGVESERAVSEMLVANSGSADIVRLRLLLARKGGEPASEVVPALAGWHNLVIAPEDSRGPGMGHESLAATGDPIAVGRHAGPVIAGVAGLWTDARHAPFDDAPVLPGNAIRVVRSFYRRLDTSRVEHELRQRVLASEGRLPLPRDGGNHVVYVDDVPLATQSMARALWAKHRDVLKGPRVTPAPAPTPRAIGFREALSMFLSFLGAALRNAPLAWYARLTATFSSAIASAVHATVYGSAPSAYTVLVNGVAPDGRRVDWRDYGAASQQLSAVLADSATQQVDSAQRAHPAPTDLSALWQDYARGALTLSDAGERSAGLPPVQVGAHRGVLRSASDVIPGAADRFTEVPGIIAATLGVDSVEPTDVLGINDFQTRLRGLEHDPALGLEARRTGSALADWSNRVRRSYGFAFGQVLAHELSGTVEEVRRLLARLRAVAEPEDLAVVTRERQRATARRAQLLTVVFLVVAVLAGVLAGTHVISWWLGGGIIGAAVLAWAGSLLGTFLKSQRELFQAMTTRQAAIEAVAADHANLRTALRDVDRLSAAYGQHQSWSRALGAFLAEPLGRAGVLQDARRRIEWGLPRSAAVGSAHPQPEEIAGVADYLRQDLFTVGWMTDPWDDALRAAGAGLGAMGHDVRQNPGLMSAKPGMGSGSALDVWSARFARGEVHADGSSILWDRALSALTGSSGELALRLIESVEYHEYGLPRRTSRTEFLAGVGEPREHTGHFDRAMFTDTASTTGLTAVHGGSTTCERVGLGLIAVTTQFTEGLAAEDLLLTTARAEALAEFEPPTANGLHF